MSQPMRKFEKSVADECLCLSVKYFGLRFSSCALLHLLIRRLLCNDLETTTSIRRNVHTLKVYVSFDQLRVQLERLYEGIRLKKDIQKERPHVESVRKFRPATGSA